MLRVGPPAAFEPVTDPEFTITREPAGCQHKRTTGKTGAQAYVLLEDASGFRRRMHPIWRQVETPLIRNDPTLLRLAFVLTSMCGYGNHASKRGVFYAEGLLCNGWLM
jgi:hypothetical protein